MVLLAWLSIAAAGVTDADLVEAFAEHKASTRFPFPLPDAKTRRRLLNGKIAKTRIKGDAKKPDRALGMVLSTHNKRDLWLASIDPHYDELTGLIVHYLPKPEGALHRWYGFVDLPFPFADRHFSLQTSLNLNMHQQTDGRIWERYWDLEADGVDVVKPLVLAGEVPGLAPKAFEKAIYSEANFGSWFFVEIDEDHTLVGYNACTVIGGDIPDNLITQYIMMGLNELMTKVEKRAGTINQHYGPDHEPILGGDGSGILPKSENLAAKPEASSP